MALHRARRTHRAHPTESSESALRCTVPRHSHPSALTAGSAENVASFSPCTLNSTTVPSSPTTTSCSLAVQLMATTAQLCSHCTVARSAPADVNRRIFGRPASGSTPGACASRTIAAHPHTPHHAQRGGTQSEQSNQRTASRGIGRGSSGARHSSCARSLCTLSYQSVHRMAPLPLCSSVCLHSSTTSRTARICCSDGWTRAVRANGGSTGQTE